MVTISSAMIEVGEPQAADWGSARVLSLSRLGLVKGKAYQPFLDRDLEIVVGEGQRSAGLGKRGVGKPRKKGEGGREVGENTGCPFSLPRE
jgi:hypothetical protein